MAKIKVLINTSSISEHARGMGIFTQEIIKNLLSNQDFEFIIVSATNLTAEMSSIINKHNIRFCNIKLPLPIFEQIIIPFYIWKYKVQICWFPSNTYPLLKISRTKYVVTIHDLIFLKPFKPQSLYQKFGKIYRKYNIILGIKLIDQITTVSQTILEEIIARFHISNLNNTHVLYNSINFKPQFDNSIIKELNLHQYVYTISGNAPHKNLKNLIEAFNQFNQIHNRSYKLVVTGVHDPHLSNDSHILYTQYINHEQKNSLMQHADFFIMASLDEGFGIPIIEALYLNPSVMVSNIPIFHELGQKFVTFTDTSKENFLNQTLKKINHEEAKQYIQNTFNVDNSIKKIGRVFHELA